MTPDLTTLARGLMEQLHQMRTALPNVPDETLIIIAETLIIIAETLTSRCGLPIQPPKVQGDGPPTLAAAITQILKASGRATRGELLRAIRRDNLDYLAEGEDLYGTIGRVLAGPQFAKVHRGLYCLAADMPKPEDAQLSEKGRTTLMVARKLTQPFMARDVMTQGSLTMPWVIVGLKELNRAGKVKVSEVLTNGTARWKVL
jgi:hypothetical protein